MAVPILGQTPTGICVLCKGVLTPDHEHIYVDQKEVDYMLDVIAVVARNGCIIVEPDATVFPAHPLLNPPYMWHPVIATHGGVHEGCSVAIVHHHCDNTKFKAEPEGRTDEIPVGNVGTPDSEGHEGERDSSNPE